MELLYRVKPDVSQLNNGSEEYLSGPKRMKLLPKRGPIVAVSSKNLIAFSSNMDLMNSKSSTAGGSNSQNGQSAGSGSTGLSGSTGIGSSASLNLNNSPWSSPFASQSTEISGAHVYIADLNTPWEYNFVKNSAAQISHLQWDHAGNRLLVGTEDGTVEVYGMADNLLNKWRIVYSGNFPGEPILSSCWLGMPRKVQVVIDKIDSLIYSEKYHTSLLPSSKGFGGKSMDGCLVVTATGLVGGLIHCPFEEPLRAISAKSKISAVRNLIVCADMAYSKNGEIVVVSSGDNLKQPILVNRIEMKLVGFRDKAQITVTPSQSLFLPSSFADYSVSSVKFVSKISSDSLIISLMNQISNSTVVCLYELTQETVQLKPRFQSPSPDKLINYKWQLSSQLQFNAAVLDTCSLPVQIATTAFANNGGTSVLQNHLQHLNPSTSSVLTPMIAISLANGSLVLARADNLQQVASINGSSDSSAMTYGGMNYPIKRERDEFEDIKPKQCGVTSTGGENYVSMQFSWSGCILIAFTANCHISVYKMHPNIDPSNAAMLMELSMMGGLDSWDIMMCLRQNQVENITDRLSETFARQPPAVQTHFNARILVIKSALYRLACGGTARTNDQTTLLTLHLVSGALRALLRPGDLSSVDKGPAESLSTLLSSRGEQLSDVDKVLVHLVPKEYTVEPSTLQSLQQFLQWCADLALKLLATLPDLRHSRAPLWEVCRDSRAISILRELICLMRIWGLIRPSCLPSFRKTSENLDVLSMLFRLLTRLSVAPHDPDESLIDEVLVSGLNPQGQQTSTPINTRAYPWLYVSLVFVVVVFGLLGLAWWLERRRLKAQDKKDEEERARKGLHESDGKRSHVGGDNQMYPDTKGLGRTSIYPNPDIDEKSSLFEGSVMTTTTTEIQPKAPPLSCEKLDEMSRKSSSFGIMNIHHQQHQQSSSPASSTESGMHNQHTNIYQPPISSSASAPSAPANPSLSGNMKKKMSRLESFPFEEYGIPEGERESINVRVKDLKTYDHFLHLTAVDSDFMGDSIQEDEMEGRSSGSEPDSQLGHFESRATLPYRSAIKDVDKVDKQAPSEK